MERDHKLDIIRVIAMAMIVFCHYFQIIGLAGIAFWLNSGVQVFLIISAYLLSSHEFISVSNVPHYLKKRFIRIMIPVWIYLISIVIILLIIHSPVNSITVVWYSLGLAAFSENGLLGLGHFWYVTAMLICYAMVPVIDWILNTIKPKFFSRAIIVGIALLWIIIFHVYSYAAYGIDIAFFILVYYLFRTHECWKNDISKKFISIFITPAIILSVIRILIETLAIIHVSDNSVLYDYFVTVDKCCVAAVFFGILYYVLKNNNSSKGVMLFSGISYEVYLTHQFILLAANRFLTSAGVNEIIKNVAILIVSVPIIVIYAVFLNKASKYVKSNIKRVGKN